MTVTNDFLAFAQGGSANVESQASYAADPLLATGNLPGIAISAFNNKAIRQANAVTSQLAQLVANVTQTNVQDNANPAQLLAQLTATLTPLPSIFTSLLSSSGTYVRTTAFFLGSANATAGATYTNNGVTYTVSATISGGSILYATGNGISTLSGTLTKASGTGDATITFYAARLSTSIEVKMVGAGGGGGTSGTSPGTAATDGTATTFFNASAGGGTHGVYGLNGGNGGTSSLGTGAVGIFLPGGSGGGSTLSEVINSVQQAGAVGAATAFGGAGGTTIAANGNAGGTNTGAGGGGGGTNGAVNNYNGGGGGAGGYINMYLTAAALASTYQFSWAVGVGGTGGTAGTNGFAGGNGGSGVIYVRESFQ